MPTLTQSQDLITINITNNEILEVQIAEKMSPSKGDVVQSLLCHSLGLANMYEFRAQYQTGAVSAKATDYGYTYTFKVREDEEEVV